MEADDEVCRERRRGVIAVLLSLDYASPASSDIPSEFGVAERGQYEDNNVLTY